MDSSQRTCSVKPVTRLINTTPQPDVQKDFYSDTITKMMRQSQPPQLRRIQTISFTNASKLVIISLLSSFIPSHGSFHDYVPYSPARTSSTFIHFNPKFYTPPYKRLCNPSIEHKSTNNHQTILEMTSTSTSYSENTDLHQTKQRTFLKQMRIWNLAGFSSNIHLDPKLVAVTGETGSGKSLLFAAAASFVTGSKANASHLKGGETEEGKEVRVDMEIQLSSHHLRTIQTLLQTYNLPLIQPAHTPTLHLSRRLRRTSKKRLQSICFINHHSVTLSTLRQFSSPIVTIVDAPQASNALSKHNSRMSVMDTAVGEDVKRRVKDTSVVYRRAREEREEIQREIERRVLPRSYQEDKILTEEDIEMLQHWVDELDSFQTRIEKFVSQFTDSMEDLHVPPNNELQNAIQTFETSKWSSFSCTQIYPTLLILRSSIQSLDNNLHNANMAYESITSLSSPTSLATALETTRQFLYDAETTDSSSKVSKSIEQTHEYLNQIETLLNQCAQSIENEHYGVIYQLQNLRAKLPCSTEELENLISEWNTLSRKHGILPHLLPECHVSLKNELDGNVEQMEKLPLAEKKEELALEEFQNACEELTLERRKIASWLEESVSNRLPELGLNCDFQVELHEAVKECTSSSVYKSDGILGVDNVDFFLIHHSTEDETNDEKVEISMASSGEKARILLAIETDFPGAVGAAVSSSSSSSYQCSTSSKIPKPFAILYDEIDAHVGGRAAVSIAKLLSNQSRSSQIIAITHCASVAAIANQHIVVQSDGGVGEVNVEQVEGVKRRKELARMASGDLAMEEAEVFAEALIRDGILRRGDGKLSL